MLLYENITPQFLECNMIKMKTGYIIIVVLMEGPVSLQECILPPFPPLPKYQYEWVLFFSFFH